MAMPTMVAFHQLAMLWNIYIYQQFVLKFIYYSTPLPQWTGTYLLPWIGCVITILASLVLAKLTVKTRIGRKVL